MQNSTTAFGMAIAGIAARRPRVAACMVSAVGLVVGCFVAYFAMELGRSLKPASPVFMSGIMVSHPAQG
jgi:hypothetical protein